MWVNEISSFFLLFEKALLENEQFFREADNLVLNWRQAGWKCYSFAKVIYSTCIDEKLHSVCCVLSRRCRDSNLLLHESYHARTHTCKYKHRDRRTDRQRSTNLLLAFLPAAAGTLLQDLTLILALLLLPLGSWFPLRDGHRHCNGLVRFLTDPPATGTSCSCSFSGPCVSDAP